MKERFFNRKENSWFGPVKVVLVPIILVFGALLFYVSTKYFDFADHSGYLNGRTTNLLFFRFSVIIHLISASVLLMTTTALIFFRLELKWPRLHRTLGKVSLVIGLLFLVPTGLHLSYHSMGGILGKIIFYSLSLLTFLSLLYGYYSAIKGSFDQHKRWMTRFYILLTSALWLRLNMFILFYFFGTGEWQYLTASFLSWVPQLLIFEMTVKSE